MSIGNVEKEILCVVHWFQGWSNMQKQDFLKDLVEKAVPEKVSTLFDAMNMLNFSHKPPSIFKCQMKLFDQWFGEWTDKERNELMRRLEEVDANFVQQFNSEVKTTGQT